MNRYIFLPVLFLLLNPATGYCFQVWIGYDSPIVTYDCYGTNDKPMSQWTVSGPSHTVTSAVGGTYEIIKQTEIGSLMKISGYSSSTFDAGVCTAQVNVAAYCDDTIGCIDYDPTPQTCFNLGKDPDEIGTDCGGVCPAECVNKCPPGYLEYTKSDGSLGCYGTAGPYTAATGTSGVCPSGYQVMESEYASVCNHLTDPVLAAADTIPEEPAQPPGWDAVPTSNTNISKTITTVDNGDGTSTTTTVITTSLDDGSIINTQTTSTTTNNSTGAVTGEIQTNHGKTTEGIPGVTAAVNDARDAIVDAVNANGQATMQGINDINSNLEGVQSGIAGLNGAVNSVGDKLTTTNKDFVGVGLFNGPTLDAMAKISDGWGRVKDAFVDSPIGDLANGLSGFSGGGSPVVSVNLGSYGLKSIDFSTYANSLAIMRAIFICSASLVGIRIIIMKQH